MHRRSFLAAAAATLPVAALLPGRAARAAEGSFAVTRTEAEWRDLLTDQEFHVMREEGTERAFTSDLLDVKKGTFHCKGCDTALYASETKFESGTGWPSFWQAIDGAVGNKEDRSLFSVRTEEHCATCGSHMGHVFDDGPAPTGKRHCINGICLTFKPASA